MNANIQKGMKEWAAIIDALGQGLQIIMVRKRPPRYQEFLLFPTFTFFQKTLKEPHKFDLQFQEQYRLMARKSGKYAMEQAHTDLLASIDYFAKVDQEVEVSNLEAWDALAPCMFGRHSI